MLTSSTTIDKAMLKVKSTSRRKGGIGSMTMPSMTSSSSGMPRLHCFNPDRLLRTSLIICERSIATALPQPIQSFDAQGVTVSVIARSLPLSPKPLAIAHQTALHEGGMLARDKTANLGSKCQSQH